MIKNLSLHNRLNLLIIAVLVIVFSAMGAILTQIQERKIYKDIDLQMRRQVNELTTLLRFTIEDENSIKIIKEYFKAKKFYGNGYSFIINKGGMFIIHPTMEGEDVSNSSFFKQLSDVEDTIKTFQFHWEKDTLKRHFFTYYKFFKPNQTFVGVIYSDDFAVNQLNNFAGSIIVAFIITVIIFLVTIWFYIKPVTSKISEIVNQIQMLAKGQTIKKIDNIHKNEIGNIVESINALRDGLENIAEFSNEIKNGNLESKFVPLSSQDIIGNSLLEMRDSLRIVRDEEQRRKKEEEIQNWTTKGIASMGEVLRRQSEDISIYSDDVLKFIIKYVKANQGGFFYYKEDDLEGKYLELIAIYAYDRRKYFEKKIPLGEGVIGTCAVERHMIYMTDIPKNYMSIQSGLGEAIPKFLVIAPLKTDKQILGVIELAFLRVLENWEIEFIEKICENISITLANIRINTQTTFLLGQSQRQQQELTQREEEMRHHLIELRKTQEEAVQKEFEMRGVLNAINSTAYMAEYDLNGNIIYANDRFLEKFNLKLAHLEGRSHQDFTLLSQDNLYYDNFWTDLQRGISRKETEHFLLNDGREFWLSEFYNPVFNKDGEPYKILNISYDLSETKLQERKLEQQAKAMGKQEAEIRQTMKDIINTQHEALLKEAYIQRAFEAIDKTFIRAELSLDGGLRSFNPIFINSTGYTKDELKEQKLLNLLDNEEFETLANDWNDLLSGKTLHKLIKLKTFSGESIWWLATLHPITDFEEHLTGIFMVAIDNTEWQLKQLLFEEQQKQVQAHEIQLKELNDKLNGLKEETRRRENALMRELERGKKDKDIRKMFNL